jgi:hypothetical protein
MLKSTVSSCHHSDNNFLGAYKRCGVWDSLYSRSLCAFLTTSFPYRNTEAITTLATTISNSHHEQSPASDDDNEYGDLHAVVNGQDEVNVLVLSHDQHAEGRDDFNPAPETPVPDPDEACKGQPTTREHDSIPNSTADVKRGW